MAISHFSNRRRFFKRSHRHKAVNLAGKLCCCNLAKWLFANSSPHIPKQACIFHSCIFCPCNSIRIAFSTPAFSVAPSIVLRIHSSHHFCLLQLHHGTAVLSIPYLKAAFLPLCGRCRRGCSTGGVSPGVNVGIMWKLGYKIVHFEACRSSFLSPKIIYVHKAFS